MPVYICQGCGAEHTSWEGRCPVCGVSETIRLQQQTDRMVDRLIKGKWQIIRKLGQGGMGAVYLAEQTTIGQRVAIKFLKSEYSNDPEIARRFINEAKSYARVAHPNAVTFHEFGQDEEGNLYIAMEYCEGVDLKRMITEQGRLPLQTAVDVVLQVAEVLATAHARGIIHRDLKPENIMIREGLRGVHAKVLDFGIARVMDASTRLTVAGAIAGTPRYMAPEQVEGREVDLRADVYSLGIVLYETLTGQQPFDGTTVAEILRKQVHEPLPHLREVIADLDFPDLDGVLQRACAKRREDRWPDLLSFASALNQALPTLAHVPQLSMAGVAALSASSGGGVAVPGTRVDVAASSGATLVRGKSGAVATPTAMNEQGPVELSAIRVPRSRTPLALALGAGVLIVVGGVFWFRSNSAEPTAALDSGPAAAVTGAPPPTVGEDAPRSDDATAVAQALKNRTAVDMLARGQAEFEVGALTNAQTFLERVEAGTSASARAEALLAKLKDIRSILARADRRRTAGDCEQALPLYREVLTINKNVPEATNGVSACRAAVIDPTMP